MCFHKPFLLADLPEKLIVISYSLLEFDDNVNS